MTKHRLAGASLIAVLTVSGPSFGQSGPRPSSSIGEILKRVCKADYAAHCIGNDPAAPIAAACLSQYYVNLSTSCRAALDAYNHPATDQSDAGTPPDAASPRG